MRNSTGKKTRYIFITCLSALLLNTQVFAGSEKINNEIPLKSGWYVASSNNIKTSGVNISLANYQTKDWYSAVVPSTIMSTLVKNGVYKDLFIGENLKKVPVEQFEKAWWYRNVFKLPKEAKDKTIKIQFEGIVYRANIWLNGKQIADTASVKGVFRRFELDITNVVKAGSENYLAVEVFPPKPGEPSLGFADWNPAAPDQNMGLWRGVKIKICGPVSVNYPFVTSKLDLTSFKKAELTVSADVVNNKNENISGVLSGEIEGVSFEKKITLMPLEKKTITFSVDEFKQLTVKKPRLWWPHDMGKQELYKLKVKFTHSGKASDICETRFGIRQVSEYINEEGFRGYKINGRKIQVLGGGWVDNIFLDNDYKNLKAQINYVKQMGLNALRLEGVWGNNEDLYNLCDENGILMMTGWSCQWENDEYFGRHVDDYGGIEWPDDIKLIAKSWEDQVKWLRNHPAIFLWMYGSDRIPRPELETEYVKVLETIDTTRPVLAAASDKTSEVTGRTAVKMRGPYDYVPPIYWWADKTRGGAFGFNTEMGPGAAVPPVESVKKMIPENHLWPIDSIWNYHCSVLTFNNLTNYNKAINSRLGTPENIDEYCTKAQYLNYESARAMYEAHKANKYGATGVIYWMLNTAWPKLWWQLYDYYLNPTGGFYGIKKACEPIHIMYNYANGNIIVINNTNLRPEKLIAEIRVINFDMNEKYSKSIAVELKPDESKTVFKIPEIDNLSKTYFVDLKLKCGTKIISTNLYPLSLKQDVLDTANALWYVTPLKEYMDLSDLNKLEKAKLSVKTKFTSAKNEQLVEAEIINNTNKLAFQIELAVQKGENGESVLPISWDDNYFSLLPGEKRKIKGRFSKTGLNGTKPVLKVNGWNVN